MWLKQNSRTALNPGRQTLSGHGQEQLPLASRGEKAGLCSVCALQRTYCIFATPFARMDQAKEFASQFQGGGSQQACVAHPPCFACLCCCVVIGHCPPAGLFRALRNLPNREEWVARAPRPQAVAA